MGVFAAVVTGIGTGAISTIQLFGDSAQKVLAKIFTPSGSGVLRFNTGDILFGLICDDGKIIDQVTIGCERPQTYAINCHGNPLIVEMIIQLLQKHEVEILTAEELAAKILSARKNNNAIAIEADLVQPKVKTVEGTKIIANQVTAGLSKKLQNWLENTDRISLDTIKAEAEDILNKSKAANLIIYGCRAVLTGPPNSGKSTLLNSLAGRQKAIVADINGTTRDWVSAEFLISPLLLESIDTAGLDENFRNQIDKAAQKKSFDMLEDSDLVLLVLDGGSADNLPRQLIENCPPEKTVTVLNKSDLTAGFEPSQIPFDLPNPVQISAKFGNGIDELKKKILQVTKAAEFNRQETVCFTQRQQNLLRQITHAKSKQQAALIITELLNDHLCV